MMVEPAPSRVAMGGQWIVTAILLQAERPEVLVIPRLSFGGDSSFLVHLLDLCAWRVASVGPPILELPTPTHLDGLYRVCMVRYALGFVGPSLGDQRSSRLALLVAAGWNVAQAVAAVVVLSLEWGRPCDQKLNLWLLVATIRIVFRLSLSVLSYRLGHHDTNPANGRTAAQMEQANNLDKCKEIIDVFGLVWFTLGTFSLGLCRWVPAEVFITNSWISNLGGFPPSIYVCVYNV